MLARADHGRSSASVSFPAANQFGNQAIVKNRCGCADYRKHKQQKQESANTVAKEPADAQLDQVP
jgi:hypothetical protein